MKKLSQIDPMFCAFCLFIAGIIILGLNVNHLHKRLGPTTPERVLTLEIQMKDLRARVEVLEGKP